MSTFLYNIFLFFSQGAEQEADFYHTLMCAHGLLGMTGEGPWCKLEGFSQDFPGSPPDVHSQ